MFIGRKQELQFLEKQYSGTGGKLVVLYGRRRVGKTETLHEFCKGKPHVFYSCREISDKLQLRSFSEKMLREKIPAADYIREFADWESALKSVLQLPYGDQKKLLIIDELGYLAIDAEGADLMFQLVSTRYEQRSTIITTNVGIGGWARVFGDDVAASAIADRVCHHCTLIRITGRSYRLKDLPTDRRREG